MQKWFMVSEDDLKELLSDSYKLTLLENGGVDDWEWYGESLFGDDLDINLEDYNKDIIRFISQHFSQADI